jgi:GNAT superfamily N-acetyltransferase
LRRLVNEYQDGINRFDKKGEALLIAYFDIQIVGICGLNQDPYSQDGTIGRVRLLYVSKAFRRLGVGRMLMNEIVDKAKKQYGKVVLKTDNPVADKFYKSIGFCAKSNIEHSTHEFHLD